MMELEPSVLMPPVQLSTVPIVLFSIEQHRHPEVEAEIDYCRDPSAPTGYGREPIYRECLIPRDGHFPFLIKKILGQVRPPKSDEEILVQALNDEFAQLRRDGLLGDVVILHDSLYALITRNLASGEFVDPMEIVFDFPHPAQPSSGATLG